MTRRPRPTSPDTLAAVAQIPRYTRAHVAALLGLHEMHVGWLCRRYLDGARLLSDLDIEILRDRPKLGPKGPHGQPPAPPDPKARRAAAWGRIIDPNGFLKALTESLTRKEAP